MNWDCIQCSVLVTLGKVIYSEDTWCFKACRCSGLKFLRKNEMRMTRTDLILNHVILSLKIRSFSSSRKIKVAFPIKPGGWFYKTLCPLITGMKTIWQNSTQSRLWKMITCLAVQACLILSNFLSFKLECG